MQEKTSKVPIETSRKQNEIGRIQEETGGMQKETGKVPIEISRKQNETGRMQEETGRTQKEQADCGRK